MEYPVHIIVCCGSYLIFRNAVTFCHSLNHERQIGTFVALATLRHWRHIWRICFKNDTTERYLGQAPQADDFS
jgi:hypothetical protein